MKYILTAIFIATTTIATSASAAKTCLFSESLIHTSENRHCSDDCSGWAAKQPNVRLQLEMPENWGEKGAFFSEPKATCGGAACTWAAINSVSITNGGQTVVASYRNWGYPIEVTVQAEICILE